MPNTDIVDLADGLLTDVVDAYADAGVDLPDRRYIHAGLVAFDCEQTVVTVGPVFRGQPAQPSGIENRPGDMFVAELAVWLVRCVPTFDDRGNPPSADKLNAAGRTFAIDAHILTVGLAPKLRVTFASCRAYAVSQLEAQGPEGGFGGWLIPIQVGI